ncbi:MAG: YdgA family protein, partial [Giesbergeria sp.]
VGASVAVLLVAYTGATWYLGEQAQKSYEEVLADAKKVLGPDVVLSQEYKRGFFASKANLVLQWSVPLPTENGGAPAPQSIRIAVDSTVRHSPMVGGSFAAAVVESHFSVVEPDAAVKLALAKVTAPTLTTVHQFTGGKDIKFALPAGEIGDAEQWMRWKDLTYKMHIGSDDHLNGTFEWPEMSFGALKPSDAEMDDEDAADATSASSERFTITMQGMGGDFETKLEDGLWLASPGKGKGRFDKIEMTHTVGTVPPKTLLALQDMGYTTVIERTGSTLGWTSKIQTKGSIGPLGFDAIGLEETISRIDIEALKLFQKTLVAIYRGDTSQAPEQLEAFWKEAAPQFVAALPSYGMKISATLEGQEALLEYGAEVKKAPSTDEVGEKGWGPALLNDSVLHAGLHLPKAWLPRIAHAITDKEMPADQIDSMVGMGQAQGILQQEGDQLISAVRLEGGKLQLNGKSIDLPSLLPMAR